MNADADTRASPSSGPPSRSTGGQAACGFRRSRRKLLGRPGVTIAVVLLLGGGALATRWHLARRSLAWQARRGLELLEGADTPAKVRAALDHWESETRPNWEGRSEELITYLFTDCPLEDQRVRLLLTRVAGADYGQRREDWQRWYEARRRLREGLPPKVARRDAVPLKLLWKAPVGLTAWFTTILPLDGQIYVASLGAEFDDPEDGADGVVRVDGTTGAAELFFIPPPVHPGPRDVVGVAANERGLFVACHNGSLFCIDVEGRQRRSAVGGQRSAVRVRWNAHVGDSIVAPPLAVDTNRDGVTDVIVATRAGKVVALSGRQGKTTWVATVAPPPVGESMLGATLSLGDVLPGGGQELTVTMPPGELRVLATRDGQSLWQDELAAGTVAGALCSSRAPGFGPPAYVGDRAACVWSLVNLDRSLERVRWRALALRRDETLVAGLRTLAGERGSGQRSAVSGQRSAGRSGSARRPPASTPAPDTRRPAGRRTLRGSLLLACPTGDYAGQRGAVCVLAPEGVCWRLPVGGAVWGTPAVADLNSDGRPEIVVASIEPHADGGMVGVVTIVSPDGHAVQRMVLDAPIECSPVVADVDGDSHLEVLVADQAGWLHCFGTEGYGPVEWGLFGGDSHNTRNGANAYAFGQAPCGYQWEWRPE